MRRTGISLTAALVATLVLSGCGDDDTKFLPPEEAAVEAYTPTFDGSLEAAAAVLPLVPEDVVTVTVTDFEQVRLQMGLPDLSTEDAAADRDAFWVRADAERPLLSPGLLRPIEPRLTRDHGLSQLDVAWEAHFYDASGTETGFVLALRDGTDMTAVADAVSAGFAVLEGATVDADRGLVTVGAAPDGEQSWAVDADARALVGPPANATYLSRDCTDQPVSGDLDELALYSVQFEGALATARLGEDREDLFTRMRVGEEVPEFDAAFDGGVADPLTGRIGYVMTDPAAAAALAIAGQLPFAACP
ncbi:hypothetical protein [Nocardioides sp.]|uniref:hypothetical protein n=1 Tax=Nocardioides sp. TaxID=35761 RepID=UPI001A26A1B5|nr:hypothetical protein [Nocardioides sp.]MBJ7358348.1 hypothetical protein [Nocardioides sp.]